MATRQEQPRWPPAMHVVNGTTDHVKTFQMRSSRVHCIHGNAQFVLGELYVMQDT